MVEHLYCVGWCQGYLEVACQAVAAAAGNDAQRHTAASHTRHNVVDAAVAAHSDNGVKAALLHCFVGKLFAVVDAFGVADSVVDKALVDGLVEKFLYFLLLTNARYGIDDKDNVAFHIIGLLLAIGCQSYAGSIAAVQP